MVKINTMDRNFAVHGEFTFYLSNNILISRIAGAWNQECAQSYVDNFKAKIQPLMHGRWGHLVLLDDWELSVPNVSPIITSLVSWSVDNGLEKSAQVYSQSMIKKHELNKMLIDKSGNYELQVFSDIPAALRWLEQFSFSLEKSVDIQKLI